MKLSRKLSLIMLAAVTSASLSQGCICKAETLGETDKNTDIQNKYYVENSTGYYVKSDEYYKESFYDKYQWDVKRVTNNGVSYYLERGNHDVVVGIIDSGVDTDHPDLKENFLGGKNFVPENFGGETDETGDINDVEDRLGHGTNIAGQIAANGNIKGVAPGIGFKSYRIYNKKGLSSSSIMAKAIMAAVDDGVDVLNLSFGVFVVDGSAYFVDPGSGMKFGVDDNYEYYTELKKAVDYAVSKNVVVVTAAGNHSFDCSSTEGIINGYKKFLGVDVTCNGKAFTVPGSFANVINTASTDKNDNLSLFSDYGKGYISVAAPAGLVDPVENKEDAIITTSLNGDYEFVSGTSFSAPKVSAEAALILCKNKNLTPSEVKEKILDSADKKDNESYYGAGIINVYNALK